MTTYSTQLFAGEAATNGQVLYTAPSGLVTVVRDVELWNSGAGPSLVFLGIYASSGPLAGVFGGVNSLATSTPYQWQGRVVMLVGQTIRINFAAGPFYVILSGYQLSG